MYPESAMQYYLIILLLFIKYFCQPLHDGMYFLWSSVLCLKQCVTFKTFFFSPEFKLSPTVTDSAYHTSWDHFVQELTT